MRVRIPVPAENGLWQRIPDSEMCIRDRAQGKYQVAQRFGRINIDEERIIVTFDLRIVETVLYKPCLPHTARGDQRQIIAKRSSGTDGRLSEDKRSYF